MERKLLPFVTLTPDQTNKLRALPFAGSDIHVARNAAKTQENRNAGVAVPCGALDANAFIRHHEVEGYQLSAFEQPTLDAALAELEG
jgi:hypothetical protein